MAASTAAPEESVTAPRRPPGTGAVWAAVVGGFARLEGQRWHKIEADWNYPRDAAWALLVDRDGTLWVATGREIVFLPEGEKRFQTTGIHVGEVWIEEHEGTDKARDLYGLQVDTCARVQSLGQADQILLSRFPFDSAR